ncbi:MAG: GNAT family N-acetyltransferase [Dehalococcoidia bacterium]|nr:GNAT family N-acetyltransferase [Dehalococcoidia bacterium]
MPDEPASTVVLRGPRVLLRPVEREDLPSLFAILAEPEVSRWWSVGSQEPDEMGEYLLADSFSVVLDGEVVGWVGFHEEDDPGYRHAGLDIFLASAIHGRGYGPEALRLVIGYFVERGHHRFTIDPAAANERAIRAYGAIGFRPVGLMHAYERGPDGGWHDGLLMDLLAPELR